MVVSKVVIKMVVQITHFFFTIKEIVKVLLNVKRTK